ncbi:hypothetical protein Tcan_00516, partial [Toxocara canis]
TDYRFAFDTRCGFRGFLQWNTLTRKVQSLIAEVRKMVKEDERRSENYGNPDMDADEKAKPLEVVKSLPKASSAEAKSKSPPEPEPGPKPSLASRSPPEAKLAP